MNTYRLTFQDDRHGAPKYVEFEGRSAADALTHLARERVGRRAELSQDGKYLATLRQSSAGSGIWFVEGHAEPVLASGVHDRAALERATVEMASPTL